MVAKIAGYWHVGASGLGSVLTLAMYTGLIQGKLKRGCLITCVYAGQVKDPALFHQFVCLWQLLHGYKLTNCVIEQRNT